MKDMHESFAPDFSGLDRDAWFEAVEELAEEHGYFEPLGADHSAAFIDAGRKLIVTFESYDAISARSTKQTPRGFDFVQSQGWSHLAIIAHAPGWYRDQRLYRYFDRLVDDGFFEDFEQVLFYGHHQDGYAAAAYSVVAPGARVLALRPVATLDPAVTNFDSRYKKDRRICFTDRYGYAPDMIDAADRAYVVYDPTDIYDAMQAALFTRPNVQKLHCRAYGGRIEAGLDQIGATAPLIEAAMAGNLTSETFGEIYRKRRTSLHYLRYLLAICERQGRTGLAIKVCDAALKIEPHPFFARRRETLMAQGSPVA